MADWTHPICEDCWAEREGDQEPVRVKEPFREICCFCGNPADSGIYVRHDPVELECKGRHR